MCSFWQLADLHSSFMRMPTLLKVGQLTPSACRLCCCCSSHNICIGYLALMFKTLATAGHRAIGIQRRLQVGGAVRAPVC